MVSTQQSDGCEASGEPEVELKSLSACCRKLLETLPDHFLALDPEGRIVYTNFDAPGVPRDEAVGSFIWESVPPEFAERARRGVETVGETAEPLTDEIPFRRAAGDERWFEFHVAPVITDGQLQGFTVRATDVTARHDATAALQESERKGRKLANAVEHSPAVVEITDAEGRIEYVNPRFVELSGYREEEVLGKTPSILNAGVQSDVFYRDLWATILRGETWHGEFCNRKKTGELYWVSASISPLRGADGSISHFVAVKEDVTQRRRAVQELQRAYAEVQASRAALEKTEALRDELVHMIVHDMRSSLSAVKWTLDVLTRDRNAPLDEAIRRRSLERVESVVTDLMEMANAQLEVSRLEADRMPVNIGDHDLVALARRATDLWDVASDSVHLSLLAPDSPVCARCDPRLTERVMSNLISNAIKHAGEASCVTVEVRGEDGFAHVSVADTGRGIHEDQREQIFEKFTTATQGDAGRYSTGLGLTFCRMATEAQGGEIGLDSQPGQGSTFWFRLPVSSDAQV